MENQKSNFFKNRTSLLTFVFYITTILIAGALIAYFYLTLNSSNEKVDKLDAEINTLKLTALELKERAERVTNNFASGGGTIIRIFETKDSTDVVKLEDYFSFDRYHLNYKSNSSSGEHFNWDTKNRGRIVFEEFEFNLNATTIDKYISIPFDINSNSITMTGLAEVRFKFKVESLGELLPISNTGDTSEIAEFEIV